MDAAEVGKQLTGLFGDWKSPHAFTRVPMPYRKLEALNKSFETPDKSNAFFIAGQLLEMRDDDPDYPALVLGDYMLGGGFLNSRLATRIRQKEGLSYGVGSQFSASAIDKSGAFVAYAIYAPQNATKLESAFKEEMSKALEGGFTDKEVADAKSGLLQNRQISRSQDGSLARTLSNYMFLDRKFTWDAELEKKIAALTPAEVQAALKRHLDVNAITIMKAGDFAKANKPAEPAAQPVK